jgi:hypothetical protein
MRDLCGRLRVWLQLRQQSFDPAAPQEELPQLESDIVVIESDPDPDMKAWSEAFAAASERRREK